MLNEKNEDGLMDMIYRLLWEQQDKKDQKNNDKFEFFIPHTILFRNKFPQAWYFSNQSVN